MAVALLVCLPSVARAATPLELATQARDACALVKYNSSSVLNQQRLANCQSLTRQLVIALTPPCGYTVSPYALVVPSAGGSQTLTVNTASTCPWSVSTAVVWILSAVPSSGTGSGSVIVTVAANTSTAERTGTVTLAGATVTVTQAGVIVPAQPSTVDFVGPGV